MATHDYNLANQDGASFRSDLNNALAAIVSNNSSSTAPATTFAHQIWVDTTANVVKQRNAANDAWVELWRIDGGFNAKTFSSNITLNAQSDLRFADSDSSNWVAFQAPATVSSNVTWTLPSADGTADQALTTNGSGVLSWADAGGVQDNITEGNTSAEVVDTGSDGHFKVVTEGTEALRIDSSQRVGIGETSMDGLLVIKGDSNAASNPSIRLKDGTDTREAWISNASGDLVLVNGGDDNVPHCKITLFDGNIQSFETANTERMRIDSSGRVGIGTTSPGAPLEVQANSGAEALFLRSNSSEVSQLHFRNNAGSSTYFRISAESNNTQLNAIGSSYLSFVTNSSERMRIAVNGEQQHFGTLATNINIANTASAGTTYEFLYCQHSSTGLANGTNSFKVTTNGNVYNTNNSYGSLSDQRLKENIVDATSQWNDIKGLQVRKYNFREATGHETHTQIGLIAQEVESVSPGLVQTDPVKEGETVLDADGNQLQSIKSINYSVLYMKAVKALQEAMERIETLETANASLEARLTALENA